MALLHEEEDDHNHKDKSGDKWHRIDTHWNLKRHIPREFVIVVKFGGHVLCHLASRLTNVIRQGGREAGRQTKNLVLVISFFVLMFLFSCTVSCTISGFSNIKAVTFCCPICL